MGVLQGLAPVARREREVPEVLLEAPQGRVREAPLEVQQRSQVEALQGPGWVAPQPPQVRPGQPEVVVEEPQGLAQEVRQQ